MTRTRLFHAKSIDAYCMTANVVQNAIGRIRNDLDVARNDPAPWRLGETYEDCMDAIDGIIYLLRLERALWDEPGWLVHAKPVARRNRVLKRLLQRARIAAEAKP
jgi:hypothetical protein